MSGSGYTRKGEWSVRPDFTAECQNCDWRCTAQNAQGIGAQHARKRRHCVRVEIINVRIYNHEP